MSDDGVLRLGNALAQCPNLRFVYLYSSGFKAATKVTDAGKAKLRDILPPHATPVRGRGRGGAREAPRAHAPRPPPTQAFDHKLSRYLKEKSGTG